MNRNQQLGLVVGLVAALAVALFPPWRYVGWGVNGELVVSFDQAAGRALFFLGPPERRQESGSSESPKIDGGQLLSELAIIAVLTGLAVCALAGRSGRNHEQRQ